MNIESFSVAFTFMIAVFVGIVILFFTAVAVSTGWHAGKMLGAKQFGPITTESNNTYVIRQEEEKQ